VTAALLIACVTVPLPEPSAAMAAASPTPETTVDDLTLGRALLLNRCGNCHEPPHPEEARSPDWPMIFADMTRRARLAPDEARRIEDYVSAWSALNPPP